MLHRLPAHRPLLVLSSVTLNMLLLNDEMLSLIRRLPDESCALDGLPTPQLKVFVVHLTAPFLCELYNSSLSTASIPAAFNLIESSDLANDVGVDIDLALHFDKHIDRIVAKAYSRI